MTHPIDLLDEATWTGWPESHWEDSEWLVTDAGIATVGDLRRLLTLAREAERLREGIETVVVIAADTRPVEDATAVIVRVSEAARLLLGWESGGPTPHLSPDERAALEGTDR